MPDGGLDARATKYNLLFENVVPGRDGRNADTVRPALAQKVPDKATQEALIKGTLLTFNDANVTGNYTVLHAKSSKPFRDQFPPDRLQEAFKDFREKHIDFDIIAARQIVMSQEPKVNDDGKLMLYGYLDASPKSRVHFELEYIMSEGEWKPIKINVNLKAPD